MNKLFFTTSNIYSLPLHHQHLLCAHQSLWRFILFQRKQLRVTHDSKYGTQMMSQQLALLWIYANSGVNLSQSISLMENALWMQWRTGSLRIVKLIQEHEIHIIHITKEGKAHLGAALDTSSYLYVTEFVKAKVKIGLSNWSNLLPSRMHNYTQVSPALLWADEFVW